jgi:tetratricopeptide (TPR) repeat protein
VAGVAVSSWQALRARRAEAAAVDARDAEIEQRREAELQRDAKGKALQAEAEQRRQAVAQKQRADDEAAITRAVNEFLRNDLLGQVDISNQASAGDRNPNITVRELLDRAGRAIETKFAGQELTEASIRLTLGDAYLALGEYGEAQKHLERSLALRKTKLRADHPDTLASLNDLGVVYEARGRYDEAEALFKEALQGRRAKLGADNPDTLLSLYNLAALFRDRGRYSEAGSLLLEAVAGARKKLGLNHPSTQSYIYNLNNVYEQQGKPERAEPLLREVAAAVRQKSGRDSAAYAGALAQLSRNLLAQKNYAEAEPVARECLAIRQRKQPDAWTTFNVKSMLGEALLGQKRYAEAGLLLLEGYQGMKEREAKIDSGSKARLTEALERLVRLYEATGKKDEAAKWRKKLEEAKKAAATSRQSPK